MNKNVLIVLAGGFVVAILVAVLVQASLGGKKVEDTGPKTQVLVAAKDLALGKDLQEGDLKWQSWPGEAFKGAITRKAEQKPEEALKGRMTQRISAGQPVLQSYIFKEGKGNVVAGILEKGMRAVAIPVKAFTMAGGFVTPGDFVDVILTYKVSVQREEKTSELSTFMRSHVSETILKDIRVLAVDQDAQREKEDAKIAKTVTLAVKASDAEKLSLAAEMGDITLALRGLGDDTDANPDALTTDIELSRAMQKIIKINKSDAGSAGVVRVYNGANMVETRPRSVSSAVSADSAETGVVFEETEDMGAGNEMELEQAIGVITDAIESSKGTEE